MERSGEVKLSVGPGTREKGKNSRKIELNHLSKKRSPGASEKKGVCAYSQQLRIAVVLG